MTFGFWRRALNVRPLVVIAYRNPLEDARSLMVRDGITKVHGLANWERHTRQSLADAAGLPVFVTSYDDMLGDLAAWYEDAAGFLRGHGFHVRAAEDWLRDAHDFVDTRLRHSGFDERRLHEDADVLPQHVELYRLLHDLRGVHDALPVDGLPAESAWVDEFLEQKRAAEQLRPALAGAR